MKPDRVDLTPAQADFVAAAEQLLAAIPKTYRWKATHCVLELDGAGHGWRGWRLGPHGHSGDFWLIAPDGTKYSPGEILELRQLELDTDFQRVRIKELENLTASGSVHFNSGDAATLRAAAAIIARAMPREVTRRTGNVVEIPQAAKK